eukprot:12930047-Prorocentrum_lima.AAC.1
MGRGKAMNTCESSKASTSPFGCEILTLQKRREIVFRRHAMACTSATHIPRPWLPNLAMSAPPPKVS